MRSAIPAGLAGRRRSTAGLGNFPPTPIASTSTMWRCCPKRAGWDLGESLVDLLRALGIRSGFTVLALTAVNRSTSYWRRRGFSDYSGDGVLAAKLASYGDDAVYMISEV